MTVSGMLHAQLDVLTCASVVGLATKLLRTLNSRLGWLRKITSMQQCWPQTLPHSLPTCASAVSLATKLPRILDSRVCELNL